MTKDEAKALIRTAPTVEATFAEVDAEFQAALSHFQALKVRHDGLQGQLTAIAVAKAELQSTGELAPETTPVDKPKSKGR
jgi:hypothetical protein